MLKYAYQIGVAAGMREAGLEKTGEGSTWLPALLGGAGGAGIGGALGGLGGYGLSEALGVDREKSIPLGVLLGGLAGAGLGGYGGHQLGESLANPKNPITGKPPDWYQQAHPQKPEGSSV